MSRDALRNVILGVIASLIAAVLFSLFYEPFKEYINRSYSIQFKAWHAGTTVALLLLLLALLNLRTYQKFRAFELLQVPARTKFYRRMFVSSMAKKVLAKHCTQTGFWKSDDVVFIESGTLPVFMVSDLYKGQNRNTWPKLLITNNLACSAIAMTSRETSRKGSVETSDVYPDEATLNCIHIGGQVIDDYAATIPEDLIYTGKDTFWHTDQIVQYLESKGVNHVVMMCSRLAREDGPCAVGIPMRRFKKLLLRYVAEHPDVRLSILGEAEKFSEREGKSADRELLPEDENVGYWETVLANGRTTIIAAISPKTTKDKVGRAKQIMRELQEAHATCILLDEDGRPMSLGS